MKPLLLVLLLLVGVLAFTLLRSNPSTPTASTPPVPTLPAWEQPIPEGTELLSAGDADVQVRHTRRNDRNKAILEFEITEAHGYMVDGINVEYWYRGKGGAADANTGGAEADAPQGPRIVQFVPERLGFDQKLVAISVLRDIEFDTVTTDLGATTTEEWACRVMGYTRAMRKK